MSGFLLRLVTRTMGLGQEPVVYEPPMVSPRLAGRFEPAAPVADGSFADGIVPGFEEAGDITARRPASAGQADGRAFQPAGRENRSGIELGWEEPPGEDQPRPAAWSVGAAPPRRAAAPGATPDGGEDIRWRSPRGDNSAPAPATVWTAEGEAPSPDQSQRADTARRGAFAVAAVVGPVAAAQVGPQPVAGTAGEGSGAGPEPNPKTPGTGGPEAAPARQYVAAPVRPRLPIPSTDATRSPSSPEQTVNVTIGRVEIRAPASGARPPRSPAAATPGVTTLEEYVRRRARGSGR